MRRRVVESIIVYVKVTRSSVYEASSLVEILAYTYHVVKGVRNAF